jgi:hypothetical protein
MKSNLSQSNFTGMMIKFSSVQIEVIRFLAEETEETLSPGLMLFPKQQVSVLIFLILLINLIQDLRHSWQ